MQGYNENNRPLWAPWRIKYILSEKTDPCFLCNKKLASDDDDEYMIVFRADYSFVMLNAFPYNPGHLMICPYEHLGDITELGQETLIEMMELCIKSKEKLVSAMNPNGFNIGFNLGPAAGAGLDEHVHMHIVPRWIGDTNFMPVLGKNRVVPQALRDTANLLRKHFG